MKTPAQELGDALAKDLNVMSDKAQSDVAEALGVSQQTISNWMTGKHLPRTDKLLKLHDVFGEGSATAHVIEHIKPLHMIEHPFGNLVPISREEHNAMLADAHSNTPRNTKVFVSYSEAIRSRNFKGLGKGRPSGQQSNGPSGPPPPMDSDDLPTHMATEHHTPYGIESFERQRDALSQQELHDALSRAIKGVDLARQVLDDASVQLARAMQQVEKA